MTIQSHPSDQIFDIDVESFEEYWILLQQQLHSSALRAFNAYQASKKLHAKPEPPPFGVASPCQAASEAFAISLGFRKCPPPMGGLPPAS